MAKKIKSIQCPKCGSINKTELEYERYKCNGCGVEYFLDNDDININHSHSYEKPEQENFKYILILFLVIIATFSIYAIIDAVSSSDVRSPSYHHPVAVSDPEPEYEYDHQEYAVFENPNSHDVNGLVISERIRSSDRLKEIYAVFYNVLDKEKLKLQKLDVELDRLDRYRSTDLKLRMFDNGDLYLLVKESNVYKVDRSSLLLEDVTKILNDFDDVDTGLAKINFISSNYGSGFKILANNAKVYFYYPIINRFYAEEEFFKSRHGFENLLPGAREEFNFIFTVKSTDYKDEKIQLLKYKYHNNFGGPKRILSNVAWHKDYGKFGIITNSDPYTKKLVSKWQKEDSRIISSVDFTPNRIYFNADVLWSDSDEVLIKFRPDINPSTSSIVQCLDSNTAEIKWTVSNKDGYKKFLAKINNNYIFLVDDKFVVLDKNGKIFNTLKL